MSTIKHACLIYVSATTNKVPAARVRLEAEGYRVCEVLADLDVAIASQAQQIGSLPPALKNCIDGADLCVFLLPEDTIYDGCMGAGGSLASELGRPFIAVVDGVRETLPNAFEYDAAGIVRDCDEGLGNALKGDSSFRNSTGTVGSRKIRHQKCQ